MIGLKSILNVELENDLVKVTPLNNFESVDIGMDNQRGHSEASGPRVREWGTGKRTC